jgi:UV DNA damage endonuclease
MIRLGFPVRIVGKPSLRSHARCGKHHSHLSVHLMYLRDIFHYLHHIQVRFYRIASCLLPPSSTSHQSPYQLACRAIHECAAELDALATQVQQQHLRLSIHMDHTIALGSEDDTIASHSLAAIEAQALLLDHLAPPESTIVIHTGGPAHPATLARFAHRYHTLSARARARLAVEHDHAFSLCKLLWLHQQCGIPIIFDYLHHQLYNPDQVPLDIALGLALASWPAHHPAEVHLSSNRSEAHLLPAHGGQHTRVVPPRPGQHADFIVPTDLVTLLHSAQGMPPFDLMIEAKAGDLALLRLRSDTMRVAPHLLPRLA